MGENVTGFGQPELHGTDALPFVGHHRGATGTGLPPCQGRGVGPSAATRAALETRTPADAVPRGDGGGLRRHEQGGREQAPGDEAGAEDQR